MVAFNAIYQCRGTGSGLWAHFFLRQGPPHLTTACLPFSFNSRDTFIAQGEPSKAWGHL